MKTKSTKLSSSPSRKSPETSHTPPAGKGHEGCCADVFQGKGAASCAAEAEKAFGAMVRTVRASGALSEKAKELILFSLVLHSRCAPCFDAHYQRARELGITQAELDEAAWCATILGGAPVLMFYEECLGRVQKA